MLPQKLIMAGFVALVYVVALYGFMTQKSVVHAGLIVAPILILLSNNLPLWFIIILGLDRSGLIFPGIPQGFQVVHVMMAGFIVLVIAQNIINKPEGPKWVAADYFFYAFMAVIAITIAVRGFGLRIFGSGQWGGMGYVKLFVAAGFLITSRYIRLTPKQLKTAIVLMLIMSFIPALAQLTFLASGGAIYHQYYFIQAYLPGLLGSLEASETGEGVVRYQLFSSVSITILMATLVFCRFRGLQLIPGLLLLGLAVGLGALSGFRGVILNIAGTIAFYLILQAEGQRMRRLAQMAAAGAVILLLLYPFARHLPNSMQRAISILPGIDISAVARVDAEGTTLWRLELWKMAWADVPNYLWVGKGYAINPEDIMSISARVDGILGAYLAQDYHSGPLSLLLVFGVGGFITGSGFLVFSAVEAFRRTKRLGKDPFIRRFYMVFLARYIYSVFSFFFVFGDARESFVNAFVLLAILHLASRVEQQAEEGRQRLPLRRPVPARPMHPALRPARITFGPSLRS